MVTKKDTWYERIKIIGLKTECVAGKVGITRSGLLKWFQRDMVDENRGSQIATALEDIAFDITSMARDIRKSFNDSTNG